MLVFNRTRHPPCKAPPFRAVRSTQYVSPDGIISSFFNEPTSSYAFMDKADRTGPWSMAHDPWEGIAAFMGHGRARQSARPYKVKCGRRSRSLIWLSTSTDPTRHLGTFSFPVTLALPCLALPVPCRLCPSSPHPAQQQLTFSQLYACLTYLWPRLPFPTCGTDKQPHREPVR